MNASIARGDDRCGYMTAIVPTKTLQHNGNGALTYSKSPLNTNYLTLFH